jgi:hypothetical protein
MHLPRILKVNMTLVLSGSLESLFAASSHQNNLIRQVESSETVQAKPQHHHQRQGVKQLFQLELINCGVLIACAHAVVQNTTDQKTPACSA